MKKFAICWRALTRRRFRGQPSNVHMVSFMAFDQLQLRAIRENSHPLTGAEQDYAPLFELVGNSRFVLIGEASHGTHEFYRMRAYITKRLIQEKEFTAVAAEADWPDAHRVNRYAMARGRHLCDSL